MLHIIYYTFYQNYFRELNQQNLRTVLFRCDSIAHRRSIGCYTIILYKYNFVAEYIKYHVLCVSKWISVQIKDRSKVENQNTTDMSENPSEPKELFFYVLVCYGILPRGGGKGTLSGFSFFPARYPGLAFLFIFHRPWAWPDIISAILFIFITIYAQMQLLFFIECAQWIL